MLVFTACTKEEETTDPNLIKQYDLTFTATHHGARFKGHYRFIIKDSKKNIIYDKQGYVQNNSQSASTNTVQGNQVFLFATLPYPGDTCIVTCKSSDGSINMMVFTTDNASDSLVL